MLQCFNWDVATGRIFEMLEGDRMMKDRTNLNFKRSTNLKGVNIKGRNKRTRTVVAILIKSLILRSYSHLIHYVFR